MSVRMHLKQYRKCDISQDSKYGSLRYPGARSTTKHELFSPVTSDILLASSIFLRAKITSLSIASLTPPPNPLTGLCAASLPLSLSLSFSHVSFTSSLRSLSAFGHVYFSLLMYVSVTSSQMFGLSRDLSCTPPHRKRVKKSAIRERCIDKIWVFIAESAKRFRFPLNLSVTSYTQGLSTHNSFACICSTSQTRIRPELQPRFSDLKSPFNICRTCRVQASIFNKPVQQQGIFVTMHTSKASGEAVV
jgi:hypothetical protein